MLNKNRQGLLENTVPSVTKPTTSAPAVGPTGLSLHPQQHSDSASTIRRVQKALQQSNQSQLRPPAHSQSTQNKDADAGLTSPVYTPTDDVYYEPVKVVNPDDSVTYPILHLSMQHVYNEIKAELNDEMKPFHTSLAAKSATNPLLDESSHPKPQDEPVEYDLSEL